MVAQRGQPTANSDDTMHYQEDAAITNNENCNVSRGHLKVINF